jgi:DNA-binding NtrC family response regulator
MPTAKDRYTATLGVLRLREVPGHRPGRIALQLATTSGRRDVVIDESRATIGAHAQNDVVLKDDAISRVHCELRLADDRVILRDLGSKNGTWVGNVRVHEVGLPPGGSFSVGGCTITVRSVDAIEIPLSTAERFGRLYGSGSKMGELFSKLERLAAVEIDVLVLGETGTGKELIARGIHESSDRRDGPFVVVDCTNLNEGIVESILFGHRKGTFTGAVSDHVGLLEQAHGGSLFFDELGELPLGLQAKLLRALEQRETRRIGETEYRPFDARVIAATKRDIVRMVAEERFRDDLYFRLAQVTLNVPPLRERGSGDITFLADMFLSRVAEERGCSLRFDETAYAKLTSYSWPGNVRELSNAVRNAAVSARGVDITHEDLPKLDASSAMEPSVRPQIPGLPGLPLDRLLETLTGQWSEARRLFEKIYTSRILEVASGNQSEAARMAGMSRSAFRDLVKRTHE